MEDYNTIRGEIPSFQQAASTLPPSCRSAGAFSYLNSENDHMQQMGGGYESTLGSRRPLTARTSLNSDVDEGPLVPPEDPPEILPSPPVATSNVDEHGVDRQRSGEPTSANSANEQISRPMAPGPHENLSPVPALNAACLPSAERPPPYLKTIESELRRLDDEDLGGIQQGYGDFVRRSLGKIGASQGESDPVAPKSASPDLDAFLSSEKTQNRPRPLPSPPPPGTTPVDPLCPQRLQSEKSSGYWHDLITLAPFIYLPATKEKASNTNDLHDDPPPTSKTGSFGEEKSLKGEVMRRLLDEESMLSNGSPLSCLLGSHTGVSPGLPEPIEPDRPPAYSRVDALPSGGYINASIAARPGDESTLQRAGTEMGTNAPAPRPQSNATAEESLHRNELVGPRPRPLSKMEKALLRRVEFGSKANSLSLQLS